MSDVSSQETGPIYFGYRPEINTFVIEGPGTRLLHERGSTLVHGYFTTPELAREYEAAYAELQDAAKRAGLGPTGDWTELPAWDRHMAVRRNVRAVREATGFDSINSDTIDVDTGWLAENLVVDEHERLIPGQVITAEQIAVSAGVFNPKRKLHPS